MLIIVKLLCSLLLDGFVNPQASDEKSILELTKRLYTEFICTSNAVPGETLSNEQYFVLDFNSHEKKLRETDFFTDSFIENEKLKFQDCSVALEKYKIGVQDVDEDIAYSIPTECSFFSYIYYLQAQEKPAFYKLEKMNIYDDTATAEMHFYDNETSNWDNLIYLKLKFTLISGEWKVDRITKIL